jgi:hypothetical protein
VTGNDARLEDCKDFGQRELRDEKKVMTFTQAWEIGN